MSKNTDETIFTRCRLAASIALICASSTLGAAVYTAEVNSAVSWLESTQDADGSWGNSTALKAILTAEASIALRDSARIQVAYYKGLTWLENHATNNVDANARLTQALQPHGDDLTSNINSLTASQRNGPIENGGWGLTGGYESSAIDTSLALAALNSAAHSADAQAAIDFLKSNQLASSNNGWALSLQTSSDPLVTAIVVLGLIPNIPLDSALPTVIDNAIAGLALTVSGSSPPLAQALTALAMLSNDIASPAGLSLLSGLMASQQPTGSFDDDVLLTATLLRAVAIANGTDGAALAQLVDFNDTELRLLFTQQFNKNRFDGITQSELLAITDLDLSATTISDITGLAAATNLSTLDLTGTNVTSLAALAGLSNLTQVVFQGDTLTAASDADNDTLSDLLEISLGTNYLLTDSDGDTIDDNIEVNDYGTNPALADSDGDGLGDSQEIFDYLTNPLIADTDADGLSDGTEVNDYGTDPTDLDTDGDGLTDGAEVNDHGTDPTASDTDGDGLTDGAEVNDHGTDPLKVDTDSDTLSDFDEVEQHLTDPTLADTDGDGLNDNVEIQTFLTDPNQPDTDGGGKEDGLEIDLGRDPLNPGDDIAPDLIPILQLLLD